MSLLRTARVAAAALLVAACSGADSTQRDGSAGPGAMPSEGADPEATTLAATASAEAAMCELPSGGYSAACNGCLAAQCCTQIEDCKGDAACVEQLRCIVECQADDDPTECSMGCARGDLHAGYVAYDDCSFVECLSTCWM